MPIPDYYINELLCVLKNNYPDVNKFALLSLLGDFYEHEEIEGAKKVMMELVELAPDPEELLKKVKNRVGTGRMGRELEDIYLIFSTLYEKKVTMPLFLAANTFRIPLMTDFDIGKLNGSLSTMADTMEELKASMGKLAEVSATAVAAQGAAVAAIREVKSANFVTPCPTANWDGNNNASTVAQWNTIVNGRAVPGLPQHSFAPMAPAQPLRRTVVGTRSVMSGKRLASSGSKHFCAFVSKLDKDTSEEDVKEFMEESGVHGAEIRKIDPTQEWHKKCSAFRVAVPFRYKEMLMSPDLWPDSAEIREWVFKPKQASS